VVASPFCRAQNCKNRAVPLRPSRIILPPPPPPHKSLGNIMSLFVYYYYYYYYAVGHVRSCDISPDRGAFRYTYVFIKTVRGPISRPDRGPLPARVIKRQVYAFASRRNDLTFYAATTAGKRCRRLPLSARPIPKTVKFDYYFGIRVGLFRRLLYCDRQPNMF